jgi:hypothetical protein
VALEHAPEDFSLASQRKIADALAMTLGIDKADVHVESTTSRPSADGVGFSVGLLIKVRPGAGGAAMTGDAGRSRVFKAVEDGELERELNVRDVPFVPKVYKTLYGHVGFDELRALQAAEGDESTPHLAIVMNPLKEYMDGALQAGAEGGKAGAAKAGAAKAGAAKAGAAKAGAAKAGAAKAGAAKAGADKADKDKADKDKADKDEADKDEALTKAALEGVPGSDAPPDAAALATEAAAQVAGGGGMRFVKTAAGDGKAESPDAAEALAFLKEAYGVRRAALSAEGGGGTARLDANYQRLQACIEASGTVDGCLKAHPLQR